MSAQDGPRDEASRPAVRRSVAGRRQQTWASRWNGGRPAGEADSRGTGWEVFSYLMAGLLAYGGIGWVIAHFSHIELFFPIGMLVGIAISLGWVVYRHGRQ
jgi:hypothetical protein